jgi:hypothetical protein
VGGYETTVPRSLIHDEADPTVRRPARTILGWVRQLDQGIPVRLGVPVGRDSTPTDSTDSNIHSLGVMVRGAFALRFASLHICHDFAPHRANIH